MHKPLILFDFDGTLVNSAVGIAHAMKMLAERHYRPVLKQLDFEPVISKGSAAMIQLLFDNPITEPEMKKLQKEFFDIYQRYGIFENQFYPDIPELLTRLDDDGFTWGIMSNGRSFIVKAMMSHLGYTDRSAVTICVDNVSKRKPDPEGVLKCAQQLHYSPENCIYVGDAITDIEAGNAAGMKTVAALYGYVPPDNPAQNWQADHLIGAPLELLELLPH